jgi:hypothetical protein
MQVMNTQIGPTGAMGPTGPAGGPTGPTGPQGVPGFSAGGTILYMNYQNDNTGLPTLFTPATLSTATSSTFTLPTSIFYNPFTGSTASPPIPPGSTTCATLGLTPDLSRSQETIRFTTPAQPATTACIVTQYAIKVSTLTPYLYNGTTIPEGIWDMNIYCKAAANNDANNIGLRWWLLGWNGATLTNLIANGSDISYIYDFTTSQTMVVSMIIQTAINISSYTDLVVVVTSHNRNASSHTAEVYYQTSNTYSHIHTSLGIPGATGPTGPTGPTGTFSPTGTNYGDYVYWNTNTLSPAWAVGGSNINIGSFAGQTNQGSYAVAIGYEAGYTNQGAYAIAIGNQAGKTNQAANSVVINATGNALSGAIASAFYAAPIRTATATGSLLIWNPSTSEIQASSVTNSATNKSFIIDHPKDENKYLVHVCLEGPESGVYYRGRGEITNNEYTTIHLPDYVEALAKDFTIQLTPIYCDKKIEQLNTSEVENNSFNVYGENCKFYWLVQGKRADIEVEPLKQSVNVKGNGPYKWI